MGEREEGVHENGLSSTEKRRERAWMSYMDMEGACSAMKRMD